MEDRFKRLSSLFPKPKEPRKKFAVSIISMPDLDDIDEEDISDPDGVTVVEATALCLIVDEQDMKTVQKVLNQNEIIYTTEPYIEGEDA